MDVQYLDLLFILFLNLKRLYVVTFCFFYLNLQTLIL